MEFVADHVGYAFDESGPILFAVVGIAVLGSIWAVVQAVLNIRGGRRSSYWLLVAPLGLAVVAVWGVFGTLGGAEQVVAEIEDSRDVQRFFYSGADTALGIVWLSSALLAVTGIVVAWAAGLSAALNAEDRNAAKTGWARAVAVGALGLVGGFGVQAVALSWDAGLVLQPVLVCLIGGAACGVACLRPSGADESGEHEVRAGRTADRVAAGVGLLVGAIGAALNGVTTQAMHVYDAVMLATVDARADRMEAGMAMCAEVAVVGLVAMGVVVVVAVVAATAELDGLRASEVRRESGIAVVLVAGVIGAVAIGFGVVDDFSAGFEEHVVDYEPPERPDPPEAEI